MKKIILLLLFFSIRLNAQCFTIGADLSYTNSVLSNGAIYRDTNNVEINPYSLFAQKGANMVRMRLFHTPQNISSNCGNTIAANDINDVIIGFTNAKSNGMKLNLAVHYGDYFNDPNKQKRPQAWNGLTGTDLLDSIYNYTFSVLQILKNNNVTPDIVAIGNETTWGFIDNTNTTDGWSWPEDSNKFNVALTAVDDFNSSNSTSIKKAVHFTDTTATWLSAIFSSQNITNYDIIGISYYPFWSNFTSLNQLGNLVSSLKTTYNKDIMIFETGAPWTTESSDGYSNIVNSYGNLNYPITPLGQKQFFSDLVNTVYNAGGKGVIYWEPAWISSSLCDQWGQGSSYENMSFFNFLNNNSALSIFDVFDFCNGLTLNNQKENKIQLYPNPAHDKVFFDGVQDDTKVVVFDVFGRIILKSAIKENCLTISELNSGVYYFVFYDNDNKVVKKMIVN
ncbi:glycosyl hydrolase 53 family protein [Flavobacterium sp.]|uniref:glycosyl hydrolase 53 family protein n=1 Tax=Flavobacterium sp. TaxID=239 RepID=UPI003BDD452D